MHVSLYNFTFRLVERGLRACGTLWRKIPLYGIFVPVLRAKWVLEPCKNCAGKLILGKVNKLFASKLCGVTIDTKKAPSGRGLPRSGWGRELADIANFR